MSSALQTPFDESSVDSTVENSGNEASSFPAEADDEEPVRDSGAATPNAGTVARAVASSFQLPNLQSHQHSGLFYLSLIEGRCRTQAANSINAGRRAADQLPESHPDVRDLAKHLFGEISTELAKAGVLPDEFAGQDLAGLRHRYLASFDAILGQIATQRTHNVSERGGFKSLNNSDVVTLSRDATNSQFEISHALAQTRFTMSPNPKDPLKKLPEGRQLPLSSFVLGDSQGQLISKSIYATEYHEQSLLGKGGFGHVYKVRNILDDQEYAVKKIVITSERLSMVGGNDQVKSLLMEVRTLAKLHHTNIVRYHHGWVESRPASVPGMGKNRGLLAAEEQFASNSTSQSVSQSMATESLGVEDLHLGVENSLKNEMQQKRGAQPSSESYNDMVVFGNSSSSAGKAGSRHASERSGQQLHQAQRASMMSQRTSFVSGGKGDTSDVEETQDIQVVGATGQHPQIGSDLILFIKMSVHPISLEEYLSPDAPKSGANCSLRHCFHTLSSARLLNAILDGVEYMHSQRIVHRDLKPGNIFLSVHYDRMPSSEGSIDITSCPECGVDKSKKVFITPCIGDFGLIAELKDIEPGVSAASGAGETFTPSPLAAITSRRAGTTLYCPPTMPKKQPIICPKLDVFSLGVIAFELVHKFNTKSERGVVLSNLHKGVVPAGFEQHRMAAGIKSMVCGDRDKRWGCEEVRQWLTDVKSRFS